ncbi:MAG: hypothetical protein ACYDA3_07990 [Gaiellaceae bacterium]
MRSLGITATTAIVTFVAAAVFAGGSLAGTSAAAKKIAFTAKYSGTAVTKVTDNTVAITAAASGSATLIGRGTLAGRGSGDSSVRPCIPFGGTGSLTGKSGSLAFKVTSGASGCGDEQGSIFAVTGHVAVTKATGKLAKAKGTLKFTGTYDRDAGTFSVKFTGSLTA